MGSLLKCYSSSGKEESDGGSSTTHLYLNVYDLTPINDYLYWVGLGIFHSGIEVHGMEYGFGAHEYPTSGVFEVEPKSCPGFVFRRSVWLGSTDMSRSDFRLFIENLAGKYHGDTYHLIAKNCNHFTEDVCTRLTGKSIPGWVNRLARLGSFFNCLLPESIQVSAVSHVPTHPAFSGKFFSCIFLAYLLQCGSFILTLQRTWVLGVRKLYDWIKKMTRHHLPHRPLRRAMRKS